MLRHDYDANLRWQAFKERFLRDVVINDPSYYNGLATLLTDVLPVSRIATFDLCRASFVRRRRMIQGKGDEQGDVKAVRAGRGFYWRYFEDPACPGPVEWIWRRIVASRASAVVVLGSIAEHGFLRLAQRRGLTITVVGEGSLKVSTELNKGQWVTDYALNRIESTSNPDIPKMFKNPKMKYWLENGGRWYSLSGWADGTERYVLPIYHPSAFKWPDCDPQYRSTIPVLKRMLEACSQLRPPSTPAHALRGT